jgi:predicted nucleotidyltransferase
LIDELQAFFAKKVDLMIEKPIENPHKRRSIERDITPIYAAASVAS